MENQKRGFKIISGGQTGVDRAALDAALELNIPCGGWCPKGRRAEDGPTPDRYPLNEKLPGKDGNERPGLRQNPYLDLGDTDRGGLTVFCVTMQDRGIMNISGVGPISPPYTPAGRTHPG
jgi:hypothetical protein